jgi:hypothetical protein
MLVYLFGPAHQTDGIDLGCRDQRPYHHRQRILLPSCINEKFKQKKLCAALRLGRETASEPAAPIHDPSMDSDQFFSSFERL